MNTKKIQIDELLKDFDKLTLFFFYYICMVIINNNCITNFDIIFSIIIKHIAITMRHREAWISDSSNKRVKQIK